MDPSDKDELTKILIDGSSQDGENIKSNKWTIYYEVQ